MNLYIQNIIWPSEQTMLFYIVIVGCQFVAQDQTVETSLTQQEFLFLSITFLTSFSKNQLLVQMEKIHSWQQTVPQTMAVEAKNMYQQLIVRGLLKGKALRFPLRLNILGQVCRCEGKGMIINYIYILNQFFKYNSNLFDMGNILPENRRGCMQKYAAQPRDEDYLHLQVYRTEQGEILLAKEIQASDTSHYRNLQQKLSNRDKYAKFVYRIKQPYFQRYNSFCSDQERVILTCTKPVSNLKSIMNYRRRSRISFTPDELHLIINNISLALESLYSLHEQLCFLEMGNIVMSKTVELLDPLMSQGECFGFYMNEYASPEQITRRKYKYFTQANDLLSRIFSLGVISLQMCNPSLQIENIYDQRCHQDGILIDESFLARKIAQINDIYLRNKVSIMLDFDPIKRQHIFSLIQRERINFQNVHFLMDNVQNNASKCSDSTAFHFERSNPMNPSAFNPPKSSLISQKSQSKYGHSPLKVKVNEHKVNYTFNANDVNKERKSLQVAQRPYLIPLQQNIPQNVPFQPQLNRKVNIKFVTKADNYNININVIKRHQSDDKENEYKRPKNVNTNIIKFNNLIQQDTMLTPPTLAQVKKNIYADKTPVKEKRNHYFSTIKEVTQNDQCYSEQKFKDSSSMTLSGRFQGQTISGMKNGKGVFYFKEGCIYNGEWRDNKMNGHGCLLYPDGKKAYQGQWLNNQFNGYGQVYNDNPKAMKKEFDYKDFNRLQEEWISYKGYLVEDRKEGKGVFQLSNSEYYEGEFMNDMVEGLGLFHTLSGDIIKGIWRQNILQRVLK